jgi:hypothetical protein
MSLFDKINLPPSEYKVHTFTSGGTFAVTGSGDVEYLVVAGGGGADGVASAGGNGTGGGGAGGFRTGTGFGVTAQSYTITVGAGGAGGIANNTSNSTSGSDSIFSTITSTGGGHGGGYDNSRVSVSGGSGGGGSTGDVGASSSPVTSPVQGFAGGDGLDTAPYYGGGAGGGSSAVGEDGLSTRGGNGGAGTSSTITGTATYYAGGGGAGALFGGAGGTGGSGGGGAGGGIANGSNATGYGSGGGGTGQGTGGNGSSGIVIIRYLTSSGITATGGTISSTFTGVANQRVVENFSGSVLDTDRWTNTGFGAGAGNTTFTMSDEVDGGALMLVSSGIGGEGIANFNNIRQFSNTGSVFICTTKSNDVASGQNSRVGLKYGTDVTFNGGQLAGTENGYNVTSISSFCADASGFNRTNTSLGRDSSWHTFKGQLTSSDYKLAVDGVMETTDTTNLPTVRLQPFLYKAFNSGYTSSSSTRYYEAYNT